MSYVSNDTKASIRETIVHKSKVLNHNLNQCFFTDYNLNTGEPIHKLYNKSKMLATGLKDPILFSIQLLDPLHLIPIILTP